MIHNRALSNWIWYQNKKPEICIGSKNFCNISMHAFFVIYLPEDGNMNGRNM
jgi:hypothetical protein